MKNKGYFGDFSKKKNLIKKITIAITVAILIFIPSVLMAINYFSEGGDTVGSSDVISVSVYDGDTFLFEESAKKEEAHPNGLVSIFGSIFTDMQAIDTPVIDETTPTPLTVNIKIRNITAKYLCYFFVDGSDRNFFIDENGQYFKITEPDALLFLTSSYSQSLYPGATPPRLYTTSNDVVTPMAAEWYYKNISQKDISAQGLKTASVIHTYDMAGALGIEFDKEPDECLVEVFKDGTLFHSATDMDLSSLTVAPGTILQFKIRATWDNSDDALFYGTVEYEFTIILRDRADFSVNKTYLYAGDFLVLSCTNITDTKKIEFSSTPDIGFTPTYFESGEKIYALIPFGMELSPGSYSLSFTYGATVEDIDITLNALPDTTHTVFPSKTAHFKESINDEALSDFSSLIKVVTSTVSEHVYLSGEFYEYTANGTSNKFDFGTHFEDSIKDEKHVFYGNVFSTEGNTGMPVRAANNGLVIKCGTSEYLGNYVILDHGLGIKTIYAHLGIVNVLEGDILLAGESIGRSGATHGADSDSIVIITYLFDVAINYKNLAGECLPV